MPKRTKKTKKNPDPPKPKSHSPGEDLFIMEYFTKYKNVSREEAQILWARQSAQTQAKYEKQAQKNLRVFKRKHPDTGTRTNTKNKKTRLNDEDDDDSSPYDPENPYEIA